MYIHPHTYNMHHLGYTGDMVKNSHGVSSKNNPKKTRKTAKRVAAKMARKAASTKKKK